MDDIESLRVIEALLFVSEGPLTAQHIAEVLECEKREASRLVKALAEKFNSNGRAVGIEEIAGGWQLRTKTDLAPWIRKYLATRPVRLSRAALEVLAVVAYRQPITRHEIESIRGVDCSAVLQGLLERKLVKIMGRKDVAGRPIIYGTTRQFLEHFNLPDLTQLPTLREFAEPPGGHARPEGEGAGEETGERSGEAGGEPAEAREAGEAGAQDEFGESDDWNAGTGSFARGAAERRGAEAEEEASIETQKKSGDEAPSEAVDEGYDQAEDPSHDVDEEEVGSEASGEDAFEEDAFEEDAFEEDALEDDDFEDDAFDDDEDDDGDDEEDPDAY